MNYRTLLPILLCAGVCSSAPMTLRELEFLVRQRTPDAEIVQQVAQRRLLAPLDTAAEQALRQSGASDPLLAALRKPELALSPGAALAEMQRQRANQASVAQSAVEDAAAHAQMLQRQQLATENLRRAGATRQMLDGLLVRLDGDELKPFDTRTLESVRVFGFYFSAGWCGPCRKFMPELLAAYQRLKAQYPGQFEIVFVSHDRSEYNMTEFMRANRMPWPAVRYGTKHAALEQMSGKSIPWLVAISDTGQALTQNAVDKKYIAPSTVLRGIEELLAKPRQ